MSVSISSYILFVIQPFLCCGVGRIDGFCVGLVSFKKTSAMLSGGGIVKLAVGAVEGNSVTFSDGCTDGCIEGLAVEGCDVGLAVGLAVEGFFVGALEDNSVMLCDGCVVG